MIGILGNFDVVITSQCIVKTLSTHGKGATYTYLVLTYNYYGVVYMYIDNLTSILEMHNIRDWIKKKTYWWKNVCFMQANIPLICICTYISVSCSIGISSLNDHV